MHKLDFFSEGICTYLDRTNDRMALQDIRFGIRHTSSTMLQSSSQVSRGAKIKFLTIIVTLHVGHFFTRFAHTSHSTEWPQGLNVTTAFASHTKH